MDSLIHIITTIVTIVFIAAVLYSLTSALRKRHRKAKVQQELAKKEHVKVANLHQYDIKPNDGYYKYPIEEKGKLRRFPQHFTAVALELANEQPYSVCLLALAEFDHGELKDTRYFYIRPPENNLSAVKGRYQWDELSKADEFGEYWQAGLKNLIEGQTLVAHNAPFVMGCLTTPCTSTASTHRPSAMPIHWKSPRNSITSRQTSSTSSAMKWISRPKKATC